MHISQIEMFYVSIPLSTNKPGFFAQPDYFLPSWIPGFRQSDMRMYVLKLTTDNGLEGVAAMPALGTERQGLGPMLGNYFLGLNPLDIDLFNQRVQEVSYIGMRNGWMDAAIWDLIGKHFGKPVWELFGGTGGSVAPYKSTGDTNGHDQNKSREAMKQAIDSGYQGIKLRVKGTDISEMADYVAAARDTAGKDMKIMVDANQGWPVDLIDPTPKWDVDFATEFAKALEPSAVYWLEEPLNRGNFRGLAQLRSNTTTPIAGGEMNSSWPDFQRMLELGSLDIYQPDAVLAGGTYAGGITVTHWLIQEIQRRNAEAKDPSQKIRYCPHTWTTGLGMAVALQMVGILPPEQRSLLEYPMEGNWNESVWGRFIKGGFPIQNDGTVKIPDGPGLGVEIDWSVIKRFGKRIYKGTKGTVARAALLDRGLKQALYLKEKKKALNERSAKVEFELPKAPF